MANTGVRHVRCPKCHGVLREPAGVPVYQCGGCGATLRAKSKTRPTETQDVVASSASPSRSGPPPPPPTPSRRLLGSSGDVASSSSTPDATSSRRQEPNPRETSDLVSVNLSRGAKDARASELQVDSSDKRGKGQAELPDAERKKHSGEAAEWKPSRSPPRHHLRQKILKTVDELKGDLSELFSKSPDLKQQQGHAASTVPASSTIVKHRGSTVAAASWRGLPSRRYRRCRADPPVPVRYGCCRHHHGKPECSSCRGHCGRPARAYQEPSSAPRKQGNMEAKRRAPPRHHCRPVLKGAPFIICSSCFNLVQVPADFAVSTTNRQRKLRCGACSAVLSYSYRDPARKTKLHGDSIDGTERSSEVHAGGKGGYADPFAPFVDDFGPSSYSTTEDEKQQPLHVSRNTSFDTVDGAKGVGRLHRLMGYDSASELLRHSPDLYESFDDRTTPDYDRKGKGVCIDDEDDDFDDSDDEDTAVLKRSAARGAVWPMPGVPGQGAIRIKS